MVMLLETASRRYLLRDPTVAGYVQDRVFKYRLQEAVEGKGLAALVVSRAPGWAGQDPVNSQQFPRLVVDAYVDPTRSPAGEVLRLDAEDRALALISVVDPLFTYPRLRGEWIGGIGPNPGLLVVNSRVYTLPRVIGAGDNHPPSKGDTVQVRAEYALTTA